MTPTSLFAGILTGLFEGLGVALIVFLVLAVLARRNRAAQAAAQRVSAQSVEDNRIEANSLDNTVHLAAERHHRQAA